MDVVLWIVLGVVLAVAELFTTTLFLVMISAGAFAAAAAAALGAPAAAQGLVFAAVSALSVLVVRPVIRRHREEVADDGATFGIEAISGASAVVLEQVDAGSGLVKIDGEIWTARAYDATQVLAAGERVRVIEVKGATAMVWRDDLSPHEQVTVELPESH